MTDAALHTFRCRNCSTVMTTPIAVGRYRCNACQGAMVFLFSMPIVTEADRLLAARGPVFNPAVKHWVPKCPQCDKRVSDLYGVRVDDIRFCSQACADRWVAA